MSTGLRFSSDERMYLIVLAEACDLLDRAIERDAPARPFDYALVVLGVRKLAVEARTFYPRGQTSEGFEEERARVLAAVRDRIRRLAQRVAELHGVATGETQVIMPLGDDDAPVSSQ